MLGNNSKSQLENHLTLHRWLNKWFSYETTRSLLNGVKNNVDEGFNPDGRSPICEFLMFRAEPKSVIKEALSTYDTNIKQHLSTINNKRTQPIVLRYFQYLALLYAEIFLDWKFNRPAEFVHHLNIFVQACNDAKAPGDAMDPCFTTDDLEKLAFWMATGAGKTLIMHINYHQYLHYCKAAIDNIVLITPNEGLSEQHLRELANSGIRCERFNIEGNRLAHAHNAVRVIEITKLVEEKTGGGLSVPVQDFEGNNLIFVDEGHKGSGGKAWRDYREKIAETGFTFEYSATFGQALAAANNADLVEEYGKAIAFDYSYRYFYGDGFGKDFRILNVRHNEESQTDTLLLGNLLSFYEQRCYFIQNTDAVHAYGLDSPLWAFVGSKVNVVYTENHHARSDVLNVIRFLNRFLKNEGSWAIHTIEKILNGDSGLSDENGTDVFYNRLKYLKELGETPAQIYTSILNEVFHTTTSGALHLYDVRNAQGEIGLKTTNGHNYFGVIFIGDTPAFNKLVENDDAGIVTKSEDVLTESLFSNINNPTSPINILIGAKKFIEGWDSWRVTAMGLLNVGKNEGSQIIQLFGRGVRLRGKNMSLKRSTALDGEHPRNLSLLETLNIFAVRANFMDEFRKYLIREEVPYEGQIEIELPITTNPRFLNSDQDLCSPKAPSYHETVKGQCVTLKADRASKIMHKTQIIDIIQSYGTVGIQETQAGPDRQHAPIPDKSLKLINWEWIHLQLLEYKQEKGVHNLIFDPDILQNILDPDKGLYQLFVTENSVVEPRTFAELERLEVLVLTILRKYIAKYYRLAQQQVNTDNMTLETLEKDDPNLNFSKWKISFCKEDTELIQQVREYGEEMKRIAESGTAYDTRVRSSLAVYIENHLYQPLLVISNANDSWNTAPPALEESEKHFVVDLRHYVCQQREKLLTKKEIFLLRNQSRGKGVGFYQNEGFYPDFILWILDDQKQRIVFIEPHGMMHEVINNYNDKISLYKRLRVLSEKQRFQDRSVHMDSFIISTTDLPTLMQKHPDKNEQEFKALHILFRNPLNPAYLSPIFEENSPENK